MTNGKADNKASLPRRSFAARLVALFFVCLFLLSPLPVGAISSRDSATPEQVGLETDHVGGAYLYNIENDFTVLSYNANETLYPTSTVKIMTGIIAIEQLGGRLSEVVTVTKEMLDGVAGNKIGFKEGEELTVEQLLYAMLVGGGNDAAHILAIHIAGSIEEFVGLMNRRAHDLGADATHYTNPSGLHDYDMYTTVADTVKIALTAYNIPLFMEITSTSKYVIDGTNKSEYRNVYNRNYFVAANSVSKYFYPDASGMNAGSTAQGGYCIVTTACRDGLTYLAVVMGAGADTENDVIYSYTEAAKLLNFAFESYANITVVKEGEVICDIPVTLSGTTDFVSLATSGSLVLYLPRDADLEHEVTRSRKTTYDTLTAPVAEGEPAGVLTIMYNDEIVGNVELVTTVAVARSEFLYTLERIKSFATGRFFIATVISAVVFTVIFVLAKAVYLHNKAKYKGRYS